MKLTCSCQNQAVHYYEWIQQSDKVKIIGRCDRCSISDQEIGFFAQWHESLRRMTPEETAVYLVHES